MCTKQNSCGSATWQARAVVVRTVSPSGGHSSTVQRRCASQGIGRCSCARAAVGVHPGRSASLQTSKGHAPGWVLPGPCVLAPVGVVCSSASPSLAISCGWLAAAVGSGGPVQPTGGTGQPTIAGPTTPGTSLRCRLECHSRWCLATVSLGHRASGMPAASRLLLHGCSLASSRCLCYRSSVAAQESSLGCSLGWSFCRWCWVGSAVAGSVLSGSHLPVLPVSL